MKLFMIVVLVIQAFLGNSLAIIQSPPKEPYVSYESMNVPAEMDGKNIRLQATYVINATSKKQLIYGNIIPTLSKPVGGLLYDMGTLGNGKIGFGEAISNYIQPKTIRMLLLPTLVYADVNHGKGGCTYDSPCLRKTRSLTFISSTNASVLGSESGKIIIPNGSRFLAVDYMAQCDWRGQGCEQYARGGESPKQGEPISFFPRTWEVVIVYK